MQQQCSRHKQRPTGLGCNGCVASGMKWSARTDTYETTYTIMNEPRTVLYLSFFSSETLAFSVIYLECGTMVETVRHNPGEQFVLPQGKTAQSDNVTDGNVNAMDRSVTNAVYRAPLVPIASKPS